MDAAGSAPYVANWRISPGMMLNDACGVARSAVVEMGTPPDGIFGYRGETMTTNGRRAVAYGLKRRIMARRMRRNGDPRCWRFSCNVVYRCGARQHLNAKTAAPSRLKEDNGARYRMFSCVLRSLRVPAASSIQRNWAASWAIER